jgi:hypothetical protein
MLASVFHIGQMSGFWLRCCQKCCIMSSLSAGISLHESVLFLFLFFLFFLELMRVLVMSVKGVRERREIDTFHLGLHESARMQPVKMEAL